MKTNNTARLISLVTVLAMMLVLCFAFATPASAASHEVTDKASLEAAIAAAKDGDVIYLKNDITLTGATGSISVKANITITSKQDDTKEGTEIYTITRAVAGFPMFSVDANSTRIILTNVTLDGANLADTTSNGGAIGQAGSSVSARYAEIREGATIKNFQANNGGAIYIRVAEIKGGTIENCTAAGSGGGVYSWSCVMTSGTIDGCKGAKGGGVYSAPISGTPSKFTGGLITGCKATNFGGGIVLTGSKEAQFSGVTISNCTAVNDGGGVYSNMSGTIAFSNGTITGCTAGSGGGFRSSSGTLTISGGEISGNTAKNGGGVSLPGGTLIMTGGAIKGNTSTNDDTDVGGGGVYATASASVTVSGGEISGNTAVRGGGMLLLCNATISGGEIKDNTATKVGGGGLYLAGDGKAVTLEGNTVISNNGSEGNNGGGIYLKKAALTITGCTISGNTATDGGGINVASGTLTITGGTISGNTAYRGGGIAVEGGTLTMSGGEVKGNIARTEDNGGAGLYVASTVTLSGTAAIVENTITQTDKTYAKGAGVYVVSTGVLTIEDHARIDNNAVIALTLTGMTYGGGLYNENGLVVMNGGSISGNLGYNNANCSYGGGVYNAGTFIMNGGSINNNVIASGNGERYNRGGAFANGSDGVLWMTGGEVSGNRAIGVSSDGGAFYIAKGVVYMTGGTITDNAMVRTTAMHAGAMLVSENATAYLAGGDIAENHHYKSTCVETASLEADADGKYPKDYELVSFVRNEDGSIELKTVATKLREKVDGKQVERSRSEFTITVPATTDRLTRSQINLSGTVYLGKTITLAEALSDDVKAALKNVIISEDGLAVTTANPLNMVSKTAQPAFINNTAEKLILTSELVDGSRVVMGDSKSAFMGVESGVSNVDFIFLANADAAYRPTLADNTLTWPTEAYQLYQSAALNDMVDFRLNVASRNAGARPNASATVAGKTYNVDETGRIIIPLAPKQIMDEITLTVGTETKTYTLKAYLEALKKDYPEYANLVDALLNYGSAAQVHFGYNTEALANSAYDASNLLDVGVEANNLNITGINASAFHSAQVDVGSQVSVAVIVKTEFATDAVVKLGDDKVEAEILEIGGTDAYVALAIYDISAADLMKPITVTVKDGVDLDTTSVLTYSIPAYAYRMQNATETEEITTDLKALVKALYAYANAASAFAPAN